LKSIENVLADAPAQKIDVRKSAESKVAVGRISSPKSRETGKDYMIARKGDSLWTGVRQQSRLP